MSSLIEPIMIVFMGLMIGGLMIAMYSPIFNVGALIGLKIYNCLVKTK